MRWLVTRACVAGVVLVGVLLAACLNSASRTPGGSALSPTSAVPAPSSATVSPAHTATTVTHMAPPPITTPHPSPTVALRELVAGIPLGGYYVPGQLREVYTLTVDRAQRVGLRLWAVDEDKPLRLHGRLYGPEGALVPQVSMPDAGTSLVGVWEIPAAGMYRLQLFGPESSPRRFTLELVPQAQPENSGGTIAYGEVRSGMIAVAGQVDRWMFAGTAGDRVGITMMVPHADGVLVLYGPDGELIAQNDDSESMGLSPVLEVTLPQTGDYAIVARLYGAAQTGSYQVAVQRLDE